jgi:thiamine-monophosphate kinase
VIGEFAAIAAIAAKLPGPPDAGQVWIGDDTAVLPIPTGHRFLFAADSMVAGVHADLALTGIDDLGWKALAAAVSDIAAMGGDPGWAVVTVACPPGTDLGRLYEGLADSAGVHHCPIVGGDLSEAPVLVVTVAVTGSCDGLPVLRSGARAGDDVWVTRPLGAAAAGLRAYRSAATGTDPSLLSAHARPVAELMAGAAARRAGATAMIDISDGLTADLGHLADASHVGIALDTVPVAEGASFDDALGGGEDYALAFTAPDSALVATEFAGFPEPIRMGSCTAIDGELLFEGRPLTRKGWEHTW